VNKIQDKKFLIPSVNDHTFEYTE